MVNIPDQKSVLGTFFPNVYISSIGMDYVNQPGISKAGAVDTIHNPHILTGTQPFGAPKNISSLQEASAAQTLKISIKGMVKESIGKDGTLQLFSDENLLNFIKIRVIQCSDSTTTTNIQNNPQLWLSPIYRKYSDGTVAGLISGLTGPGADPEESSEYLKANKIIVRTLSLKDILQYTLGTELGPEPHGAQLLMTRVPSEIDSSGNMVFSLPFDMTFEIDPLMGGPDPNHLSYFYHSYFDWESIQEDQLLGQFLGGALTDESVKKMNSVGLGNIQSDLVIHNNKVLKRNGFVFIDTFGNIWNGEVHQMGPNSWMKGASHGAMTATFSSPLIKYTTFNSKIQDRRRILSGYNKYDFDVNKILNTFDIDKLMDETKYTTKKPVSSKNLPGEMIEYEDQNGIKILGFDLGKDLMAGKRSSYFTDLNISTDESARCHFMFGINLQDILLKETVLPKIAENVAIAENISNVNDSLLEKSQILKMKVKRKRVIEERYPASDNTLTTNDGVPISFDKNETPVYLIESSEESGGNTVATKEEYMFAGSGGAFFSQWGFPQKQVKGDGPTKLKATFEEKKGIIDNTGIRHFAGTDYSASDSTRGFYQYGIELEILDPTVEILEEIIENLRISVNGFRDYANVVETITKPEPKTFVDENGKLIAGTTGANKYYNPSTNRFTKQFVDYIGPLFHTATVVNAGGIIASRIFGLHFVSFFEEMAKLFGIVNIENQIEDFFTICYPQTGNTEGVELVMKFMDGVLEKAERLLQTVSSTKLYKAPKGSEVSDFRNAEDFATNSARRIITMDYWFKEIFDSNFDGQSGYEFLKTQQDDFTAAATDEEAAMYGPLYMSGIKYLERASKEQLKYFPNIGDTTFLLSGQSSTRSIKNYELNIAKNATKFLSPSIVRLKGRTPHYNTQPGNSVPILDPKTTKWNMALPIKNDLIMDILRYNVRKSNTGNDYSTPNAGTVMNLFANVNDNSPEKIEIPDIQKKRQFELFRLYGDLGCTISLKGITEFNSSAGSSSPGFGGATEGGANVGPTAKPGTPSAPSAPSGQNSTIKTIYVVDAVHTLTTVAMIHKLDLLENLNDKSLYDLNSDGNGIFKVSKQSLDTQKEIRKMESYPNQVQRLIETETDPPFTVLATGQTLETNEGTERFQSPNQFGHMYLNYKNLARVEKLVGYAKDPSGLPNMKRPMWELLKNEDFQVGPATPMFCRIRQYDNKALNIATIKELELPIYNRYFMTSGAMTSTVQVQTGEEIFGGDQAIVDTSMGAGLAGVATGAGEITQEEAEGAAAVTENATVTTPPAGTPNYDVNGDGKVDIGDVFAAQAAGHSPAFVQELMNAVMTGAFL